MKLLLIALFIGNCKVTAYRSIPSQTDSSPWLTSIGERVHPHGVAVSPDLFEQNGGPLNYGDLIYIEDIGFKIVNDVMNKRHKQSIDIWVSTYKHEKNIGIRHKNIWVIKRSESLWKKAMKKLNDIVNIAKNVLNISRKRIFLRV